MMQHAAGACPRVRGFRAESKAELNTRVEVSMVKRVWVIDYLIA